MALPPDGYRLRHPDRFTYREAFYGEAVLTGKFTGDFTGKFHSGFYWEVLQGVFLQGDYLHRGFYKETRAGIALKEIVRRCGRFPLRSDGGFASL